MHDMYYKELFDIWFPEEGPLPKNFDREEAQKSFHNGGYYSYEFPGTNIELLALNTMYYKSENHCAFSYGYEQIDWLKEKTQATGKKFLLSMHVFPGLNYFNDKQEIFWHDEALDKFLDVIYPI